LSCHSDVDAAIRAAIASKPLTVKKLLKKVAEAVPAAG
jgi:hypothetical protein